jgi:hypothetical protein
VTQAEESTAKLNALTAKIVEAVPDVRCEICEGCNNPIGEYVCCPAYSGDPCGPAFVTLRDITLEDVLRAVAKAGLPKHLLVLPSGNIYLFESGYLDEPKTKWILGQPLHLQNKPTIDFLSSLLS